jgi:CHAT domain-containing protein
VHRVHAVLRRVVARQKPHPKTAISHLWILAQLTMPMLIPIRRRTAKKRNRAKLLPEQAAHVAVIRQRVVAAAVLPVAKMAMKVQAKTNQRNRFPPDHLACHDYNRPRRRNPAGFVVSGPSKCHVATALFTVLSIGLLDVKPRIHK